MLIVIHGPPAAGKSTLAQALHAALGLQVLSRDALAEALYDARDDDASPRQLHHRAHEMMLQGLTSAARDATPLIVEATLNPDAAGASLRDVLEGTAQRVLEVFLYPPPQALVRRFAAREAGGRHRVHDDPSKRSAQLAAHLSACRYRPLHFGDALVEIDTDGDARDVLAEVLREVARLGATRRVDYDHQPAYLRIAARGGAAWDDRSDEPDEDSYVGLDAFIEAYGGGRRFASVLDLGCGGGQAGLRFAELAERIVGIDYAETAIALARRNAAQIPHAHFCTSSRTRRWVSADELDAELEAAGLSIIERRCRAPSPDEPPVGDLLWTVARLA